MQYALLIYDAESIWSENLACWARCMRPSTR